MQSHLGLKPPSNQVEIFGQIQSKKKTKLKDVTLPTDSLHDVLALVPRPSGFSLNDHFNSLIKKLEQRDEERETEMKQMKQMKQEHDKEIEEIRREMRETDSWIVHSDTDAFDKIMLRNLLDKAQAVLEHAKGSPKSKKSLSLDWRRQLANMDQHARHESVKVMLGALDIPAAQQLSVSATAVSLLTEDFSRIRKDGDEVAHKDFINLDRCRDAIKRSKRSPSECEALNLFLELVRTYKWD
ncbi:hypothetical protein M378DRAFT_20130 [Amanita muscaria Koide BX008]|uniref:Uncharacterized protein n=1 Tax=Amanita muscaria (strain Koide BX008) TaxID=946122 RepID=A0A0C2XN66_AMAMK|nr:hypothetical protein M378DRAFT_20130 [Amanita muscaria Koide BX008]